MANGAVQVAICGIRGRMGQEMLLGLSADPEITVVGGCDPRPANDADPPSPLPITASLDELLGKTRPEAVVDFTTAEAARSNALTALGKGVPIVIGTTGLSDAELDEVDAAARAAGVGALVAPNFAIGANLLLYFAKIASQFFDAAEVIEIHHDAKIDAPSGTALNIAREMREARGRPFAGDNVSKFVVEGARGGVYGDLHVHSLRMPGFVATHEVIFGGTGQSLTIRHDSIGRDSFVPGVRYAVKHMQGKVGLVRGLDEFMGL
jgi:4-hydroxy-tetrahydrodipicolinate reductase